MKINVPRSLAAWTVMGVLLYAYMTTFQTVLWGSRSGGVLYVIILTMMAVLVNLNKLINVDSVFAGRFFWIVLALLSCLNNQDMRFDSQSRWILPMCGIIIMIALKGRNEWQSYFIKTVRFFTGIHAFFTIFFYVFKGLYLNVFVKLIPGAGVYLISKFNDGCMPGITGHYSTNGIYLGIGFVFFANDLITKNYNSQNEKIKAVCKALFVLLALVLTTKRAHILFGVIVCFVIYYFYNSDKKVSRWFYIIGAVIGLAVLVIIMAPIVPAVGNMVNRFVNADGGELSNGRIWFWEFALEKFRQNPVFGIGWGGFKHYYHMRIGDYSSTSTTVDAHNVYLQILCEMGIVGFVVFLCAVSATFKTTWSALKRVCKNKRKYSNSVINELTLSIGMQVFFVLYCFTGNCLYDCEFFFVYAISCAMAFNKAETLKEIK